MLTLDPKRRTERALAAASANLQAGAFDAVRQLLSVAEAGAITDMQQARIDLIGADLAFVTNRGSDAPSLLLKAAKRLEPIDAGLSRATYLQALCSAMFAGRLALGGGVLEVAGDVEAAPPPTSAPRASDFLLDGLVAHYTRGYAAGLPLLRRALDVFDTDMPAEEKLRWYWVADIVAQHLWDDDRWQLLTDRHVQLARDVGALSELPMALTARAFVLLFAGELAEAAALVQELQAAMEATGTTLAPYAGIGLEAFRGRQAETAALVEATIEDVSLRGEGNGIAVAQWATAVLNNGVGDYQTAMTAAQRATDHPGEIVSPTWALVELIEAAARSGKSETAAEALRRLAEITSASGTNWALGVEARSRALLSDDDTAERLYRESIERLGRTRMRADLARAHLLYGEWLRRQRRRIDARAQLRIAHDMLDAMGMDAFAERARRELQATGETTRKRSVATGDRAAHRTGGPDRADGPRRPVQSGDRCPHVHQRAHRPVPPTQGVRQARHRVTHAARPRPARLTVRLSPLPVQMAADFTVRGGAMELIDRDAERDTLDRFVAAIRAGESQALVVSGEAGVGKTALLDYLAANASGCRIARTAGVPVGDGIGLRRIASAVRAHAG